MQGETFSMTFLEIRVVSPGGDQNVTYGEGI